MAEKNTSKTSSAEPTAEELLIKREEEFNQKEAGLQEREALLDEREKISNQKEADLQEREALLDERETKLEEKEQELLEAESEANEDKPNPKKKEGISFTFNDENYKFTDAAPEKIRVNGEVKTQKEITEDEEILLQFVGGGSGLIEKIRK